MIQRRGSQIENGPTQSGQQSTQVQPAEAGPSSSVGSARHNGHTKARNHDASYQPQRQAESYTAGGQ